MLPLSHLSALTERCASGCPRVCAFQRCARCAAVMPVDAAVADALDNASMVARWKESRRGDAMVRWKAGKMSRRGLESVSSSFFQTIVRMHRRLAVQQGRQLI